MTKGVDEELRVLTVCGVGMGSSLALRMTAEDAFEELDVRAKVEATDVSSARSMDADIVIGQGLHTDAFEGQVPVVIAVSDFTDSEGLARTLRERMRQAGWLA